MAKAKAIPSLDPGAPIRSELAKILAVRASELWERAGHLADPLAVEELHAMRIAAKRLRYLLEFFEPCIGGRAAEWAKALERLQDLLGEVHDCDVVALSLRAELRRALGELDRRRRALKPFAGAADPELAVRAEKLAATLARGPAHGVLSCLVGVVERRQTLHRELLEHWTALERRGLREEIERLAEEPRSEPPYEPRESP